MLLLAQDENSRRRSQDAGKQHPQNLPVKDKFRNRRHDKGNDNRVKYSKCQGRAPPQEHCAQNGRKEHQVKADIDPLADQRQHHARRRQQADAGCGFRRIQEAAVRHACIEEGRPKR